MKTLTRLSRSQQVVSWGLQLVAAGILLQTLFFKFTAAPESVYIFSTLGMSASSTPPNAGSTLNPSARAFSFRY